jgi:hypothetical protein
VEPFGALRSAQLVAAGPQQNYVGWKRLEASLAKVLRQTKATPNMRAFALIFVGLLLVALVAYRMVGDPTTVVQGLDEMLGR